MIYLRTLQQLLKAAHCSMSEEQLIKVLQMVQEICPWFPDHGTIDLELWEQVGKNLKHRHQQGEKIPASILTTWSLVHTAECPLYSYLQNNYIEPEPCSSPSSPPTTSPPVLSAPSAPLSQINLPLPPPPPPSPEEYDCKQTAMEQCFKEGLHLGELHAYPVIAGRGKVLSMRLSLSRYSRS